PGNPSFREKASCEEGWTPGSSPGVTIPPPTQNDSGPLKDFDRSRGHTPCCEAAACACGRGGGRREPVLLGLRSPVSVRQHGATDGTGSDATARVHHAPRRRGGVAARGARPAIGKAADHRFLGPEHAFGR